MSYRATFRKYYRLTKPGIIRGNAITTAAGFFLASTGSIDIVLLLATLTGASLVVASGCVYNNVLDQGIDQKMARTKKRALVTGTISTRAALLYATLLGVAGFSILALKTNLLTVIIGLLGIFFYVIVYGVAMRRTVHGTVVGSISGAIPPLAGYTSVTGHIDSAAILIFIILVCWQMPHFYSIAMYRSKDYTGANIPVLPLVKGVSATQRQIICYIVLYIFAVILLALTGNAGYMYVIISAAVAVWWLVIGIKGRRAADTDAWARQMFRISLIVINVFSLMITLDAVLS